jgi:hypothetical protein
MKPVKVKPNDPYIYRFSYPTDKYKIIFINFKTDVYNLNVFIGIDEF